MAKIVMRFEKRAALHCDACGHNTPRIFDPRDATQIGKPCPKCGESLLTREDFDAMQRVIKFVGVINAVFGPLFGKEESEIARGDTERFSIRPRADSLTISKLKGGGRG